MRADRLTDRVVVHGEGPVWSPDWPGPRWVDMMAGDICELHTQTGQLRRRHVGPVACVVRPRANGGWLVAGEHDVLLSDDSDLMAPLHPFAQVIGDPDVRLNEGGCDPSGDLLIGSMAYDERTDGGELYRVRRDGSVSVEVSPVSISNGLGWTADGARAYYADSPTRRVDQFDQDPERGLVNRRPLAPITGTDGIPDGLCVDTEGGFWVALYGGGAVRHYSAAGELDDEIGVDATNVTAVAFGGDNLRRLFITTSRMDKPDDPGAGCLYTAEVSVPGCPVLPFRA